LWYHLPPQDTFNLLARIYELDLNEYRKRRDFLIEAFDIAEYIRTPARKLSLGERMRCELAAALMHKPSVIFLDEPTIGLDVIAKQRIRDLIGHLNAEEGVTIFLTSHDAGDIEQVCRRAVVISAGFFGNTSRLATLIMNGGLDAYLGMPRNVLLHVCISASDPTAWGDIISAVGAYLLFLHPDLLHFGLFLLLTMARSLIFTSIFAIICSRPSSWAIYRDWRSSWRER
jgi:ABC-type lipopolysaccharide export system ATPase subunit